MATLVAALALCTLGCGSRTGLLSPETTPLLETPDAAPYLPDVVVRQSSGDVPSDETDEGPCVLCRGDEICRFCRIQGYLSTYRCPVAAPLPTSCADLGERVVDSHGATHACLYCNRGDAPELPHSL